VPTAQKVLRATVSAYITMKNVFCAVGTQCKFILDQPEQWKKSKFKKIKKKSKYTF